MLLYVVDIKQRALPHLVKHFLRVNLNTQPHCNLFRRTIPLSVFVHLLWI